MRVLFFGFLLLPLVAGCGGATGRVSGQILFKGAPLPGGVVTFQPSDPKQEAVAVALDEHGTYSAALPVGEVRVAIDNRALRPHSDDSSGGPHNLSSEARKALSKVKPKASAPPPAGNPLSEVKPHGQYVPIPSKYFTIESSGLKFTVQPGQQKKDIELKPES